LLLLVVVVVLLLLLPSRSSRIHATAPSKYASSAALSLDDATMLYGCEPIVRTSELSKPF